MIEIPQNDNKYNPVDELAQKALKSINESGSFYQYHYQSGISYETAKAVAQMFVNKGYHAKITHFCESWKGWQCLVIDKKPLNDSCGRLIWVEMFG